eukprot:gb/GFBE01046508.1/.p1 GENE.gb/GFBE01046508.1/~~gb/GFBE01046508.1/.p1  ORF type:complete len:149 (+),score=46.26 gb/GFBE01046508.1/:1-447(+)
MAQLLKGKAAHSSARLLRALLLAATLCARVSGGAGFSSGKCQAAVHGAAGGDPFGPPGLLEPAELDLLDDSEGSAKEQPLEWSQQLPVKEPEPSEFGRGVQDCAAMILFSDNFWCAISFIGGYFVVQHMTSDSKSVPSAEPAGAESKN